MSEEEKEWLQLLYVEPERGMEKIIDIYAPPVKTICSNILCRVDSNLVEDAMEETFIRLWEQTRQGRRIHTSLKSYLYQIARNVSLDILREYQREKHLCLDTSKEDWGIEGIMETEVPSTEESFLWKQEEEIVHQVVSGLPEPDRKIFLLRYFYFYKVRQIADHLGLKEDNVESRLRRGLKKLRRKLSEQGIVSECEAE